MKRKRTVALLCMLTLLMLAFNGCSQREQKEKSDYYIYYLNKEKTKNVPVDYEPQSEKDEEVISDMILKLSQNPDSVDYVRPLGSTRILSWSLENGQLQLNFGSEYSQLDSIIEVLCRAAVVRTLIQVGSVDSISFYVGDAPLMDKSGTPVGLMTAESFIENPGEQINSIQTATLTLYFANAEGTGLVQEVQERHYNSNISLEKLVMEQLIAGPIGGNGMSAIPAGTKLVSVSVLDGVCFVNLDGGFLNQNFEIEEGVVIYSIVNSLAELPNVNKVQISVNGDTNMNYREKFSLTTVYERNLDYLAPAKGQTPEGGEIGEAEEIETKVELKEGA